MCFSQPKQKQRPVLPPPPEPPAELVLDPEGSKRRSRRSRVGALRTGRRALRVDVNAPSNRGGGLKISI